MDKSNGNALEADLKNVAARPKSLTPSVLGVATSHGVKLSLNMTSEDKKELMSKLEEWRKARKDKLAARILLKQNKFEKPKALVPGLAPKSQQLPLSTDGSSKIQGRQSVFERLYNNSNNKKGKMKNINSTLSKPTSLPKTNSGQPGFKNPVKLSKSGQMSHVGTDGSNVILAGLEPAPGKGRRGSELFVNERQATENFGRCHDSSSENERKGMEVTTDADKSTTEVYGEKSVESERRPVALPFKTIRRIETTEADCLKTDDGSKNLTVKVPPKNPLRRSVSMMFRQKCRNDYAIRRSFSAKNLKDLRLGQQKLNDTSLLPGPPFGGVSAREGRSEGVSKSVSFVTPKQNKSLASSNLRTKLEDWLKLKGHSLEGCRHLRCFGIANCEKSFPANAALPLDHSFENSCYATAPNTPAANDSDKENVTPPTVLHQVDTRDAEAWLKELHRLIVELKYPPERCEEWLTAIRKKCSACSQLPIFWECLAALHESKGDLTSAIEDYERAIIKGSEVDLVGDSLAQLFEKMVVEQRHPSKAKREKGIDPKNIFKSTIIKFALQQKALKKLSSELDPSVREQLYVATPVRRSTRIQTPHKSSGEVASLHSLTPELRKNVIFKPNESLLRGD